MSNKIIVKDHKYYFKIRGLGGVKGDKGDTGPAGPQGPQGPYVDVVAGTTTTLPAGSSAQVTVNNTGDTSVLNFGIPQGLKGDKGDAGTPGAQGPRGFAATVNVGQTTTGEPGTDASVVNAGNEHDAVLKFTIPKGAKGDTGDTGPQGPTGGVKSTVVAELPETGESDKYYLVNRTAEGGTVTTTDGYAQITNDENAGDLTLNKLDGNAEQKTYTGKNLLDETTIDRTITSGSTISVSAPITVSAGDYSFGAYANGTFCPESNYYSFAFRNGQTSIVGGSNPNQPITVTSAQASQIDNILCYFNTTFTGAYNGKQLTAMVCSGNTLGNYEPYTAGASPNPDYPQAIKTVSGAQTVKIVGKNLFADTSDGFTKPVDYYVRPIRLEQGKKYQFYQTLKTGKTALSNIVVGIVPYGEKYADFSGVMQTIINYNGTTTDRVLIPDSTWTSPKVIVYASNLTQIGEIMDTYDIMLEQSATATAYEPYQSQSQEINLPMLGKNQFRKEMLPATWNNNTAISVPLHLKPNTTYTFSSTIGRADGNAVLFFKDANTAIGTNTNGVWSGQPRTATTDATGNNLVITYRTLNSALYRRDDYTYQLEEGSSATTYEAPNPLELAKIGTYQDYIWNDNGTWKVHKAIGKVVLDGTESWIYFFSTSGIYAKQITPSAIIDSSTINCMSDYFTGEKRSVIRNNLATVDGKISITGTELAVAKKSSATTSDFATWLSTHNTIVYYVLATPTDTAITDADLIGQLDALAPASLYEGVNNVMLIPSAGPQGELALSYVLYDKYNQHQVYIWSSDDNTWQIILP